MPCAGNRCSCGERVEVRGIQAAYMHTLVPSRGDHEFLGAMVIHIGDLLDVLGVAEAVQGNPSVKHGG